MIEYESINQVSLNVCWSCVLFLKWHIQRARKTIAQGIVQTVLKKAGNPITSNKFLKPGAEKVCIYQNIYFSIYPYALDICHEFKIIIIIIMIIYYQNSSSS